jgi:hypothetical protein
MAEMPIWIPTGGEDMRVAVLGKRQEKLGAVTRSENGEGAMHDQSYSMPIAPQCASENGPESNKKTSF